jgi:hypothetical protein
MPCQFFDPPANSFKNLIVKKIFIDRIKLKVVFLLMIVILIGIHHICNIYLCHDFPTLVNDIRYFLCCWDLLDYIAPTSEPDSVYLLLDKFEVLRSRLGGDVICKMI